MTQDNHKPSSKDWLSIGGILGVVILFSRITRLPLATLLGLLPFLLGYLRDAEKRKAQQQSGQQASNTTIMTRDEAALILGVDLPSNESDIKEAHRNLIQKNHPDQGGSDYLAAKINQARDVLLGKR